MLLPFALLFIITLNINELRTRSRKDASAFRNILILCSLLSTLILFLKHVATIVHLSAGKEINEMLPMVLIFSLVVAIIYFLINFKSMDNYVASEYFIIAAPVLFGLSIAINGSWVDRTKYDALWTNFEETKSINDKLERISNPDSIPRSHVGLISDIQARIITASGGLNESGFLINPVDSDAAILVILLAGFHDQLIVVLDSYLLPDSKFRSVDSIDEMTAADALQGLELLKTKIYMSELDKKASREPEP